MHRNYKCYRQFYLFTHLIYCVFEIASWVATITRQWNRLQYTTALSIRPKILANGIEISTNSRGKPKFSKINFLPGISISFDFAPGIYSWMVCMSEFVNSWIFEKLSQEILIPFASASFESVGGIKSTQS